MRKMMSIKKIDSIDPIENADAIEVATIGGWKSCLLYTSPSPRDLSTSRMPSSA